MASRQKVVWLQVEEIETGAVSSNNRVPELRKTEVKNAASRIAGDGAVADFKLWEEVVENATPCGCARGGTGSRHGGVAADGAVGQRQIVTQDAAAINATALT